MRACKPYKLSWPLPFPTSVSTLVSLATLPWGLQPLSVCLGLWNPRCPWDAQWQDPICQAGPCLEQSLWTAVGAGTHAATGALPGGHHRSHSALLGFCNWAQNNPKPPGGCGLCAPQPLRSEAQSRAPAPGAQPQGRSHRLSPGELRFPSRNTAWKIRATLLLEGTPFINSCKARPRLFQPLRCYLSNFQFPFLPHRGDSPVPLYHLDAQNAVTQGQRALYLFFFKATWAQALWYTATLHSHLHKHKGRASGHVSKVFNYTIKLILDIYLLKVVNNTRLRSIW